ncbi:hypothetical protein [Nocardioides sp.]|uniref:hypothetical protein n=1 Tax=Nocardioides sp. TaxID=35761 RepID=UPI000C979C37|nr:hypothetical protein [Nocardioides sp.]MAS55418.1 hypothetical protein [Pimelobacter sp.]MDE0776650.1 hypothetical protein [Nocardioides sp.]
MSALAAWLRALAGMRHWPVSALLLRASMLLAPPAALLVARLAGDAPPVTVTIVVASLSLAFALAPDSGAGLLALGSVVAWWTAVGGDGLHPSVLVAAVLLLLAHVAGLLAAYGPSAVPVDPDLGSLWIGRGALVLLAAPVVWWVARAARGADAQQSLWQAGLLVAVLAVAGVGATLALPAAHDDSAAR